MNNWRFKLLYDGECPLCVREVHWLLKRCKDGALAVEDISAAGFDASKYGKTPEELMAVLHGVYPDGRVVNRVEAVRGMYRAAGLGWMVAPSQWPLIGWTYDLGYAIFARYRVPIGRLMGRRCEDGKCAVKVK